MSKQTNSIEWREVALGDNNYFEILSSGIKEFLGEKEYLSTESIKGTEIKKIECKITHIDRPSRANMQPVINSIWFAKMQATLKVYSFSKNNPDEVNRYILSTGFAGIKLSENISPNYMKFYFISQEFNDMKDKLCTGSTQVGINNNFIAKIIIKLPFSNEKPDLKEQERIVSILEKAEKVKAKGDNAGKLLDEYLKSVFNEMFLKDRKNLEIKKLNDVCDVRDGTHASPKYVNEGYPLITSKNVTNGFIDFSEINLISKEDFDEVNRRSKVDTGDIIMPMIGTIGNPVIVPRNIREFAIKNVALIKFNKSQISNIYIKFILDSPYFDQVTSKNNRGGTQKFIALGDIRNIPIPIPSPASQQKFAKIVEHVERLKKNVKKTKQNSEELFNSLMTKAFRGKF